MLPSERDLSTYLNVSRDTVRKAVRLLEDQGIVYSDHGRGTFVSPSLVHAMSRFLGSFSLDAEKRGSKAGQKILLIEDVPASLAIAGILEIEPRTIVTRLKRLRSMDGVPIGIQDAYLALPAPARVTRQEVEHYGSLYRLIAEKFGVIPAEGLESIGATSAGEEDAALLGVGVGTPLLICERITLSDRRQRIEYCEMRYTQAYRYNNRIDRQMTTASFKI